MINLANNATPIKPVPMPLPLSIENLKFQLIQNHELLMPNQEQVTLDELIEYLLESLEEADSASANKAENLLVRIGKPAIPFLLKGLKSHSRTVKSVSAMSLIRIGHPAADMVKEFYVRQANRAKFRWIAEFILSELGEQLPVVEEQLSPIPVQPAYRELTRVS